MTRPDVLARRDARLHRCHLVTTVTLALFCAVVWCVALAALVVSL